MKINLLIIFVTVAMILSSIFLHSCNPTVKVSNTYVSNTFGTPLGRDIDGDKNNDTAVVLHNIANG
ncbi:MAG: hypothetical protein N2169_08150, partial [bacterium]|nr:hypothetical protein [bacterium]